MKYESKTCYSTFSLITVYKTIAKMQLFSIIAALMFIIIFSNAQSQTCQWAEKIGGTMMELGRDVTTDNDGNIYITGNFGSVPVNFNNGISLDRTGWHDTFIAKYNALGQCQWAEKIGGTEDDMSQSIAIDDEGNIYVSGYFRSLTLYFNNDITLSKESAETYDLYIAKYNSSGQCQWAEKISGSQEESYHCLTADCDGNLYLAGSTYSHSISFNSGISLSFQGIYNSFISRYNTSGKCLWAKAISTTIASPYTILSVYNGFIVGGTFEGTFLSLGNNITLTNKGDYDAFVACYSQDGNCNWAKSMGGTGNEKILDLAITPKAELYVSGSFDSETIYFDNDISLTRSGTIKNKDCFIAKYKLYKNCLWAEKIGGLFEDNAKSIVSDTNSNVYIVGEYDSDTISFNNNISLTGEGKLQLFDNYLTKYNADGNCLWAEKIKGRLHSSYSSSIAIDKLENIIIAGSFNSGQLIFNNDIEINYDTGIDQNIDVFIAKYNAYDVPKIQQPANNAMSVVIDPTLSWSPVKGALSYTLKIGTNTVAKSLVINGITDTSSFALPLEITGIIDTSYTIPNLEKDTKYFWQLNAFDGTSTSKWSDISSFTTGTFSGVFDFNSGFSISPQPVFNSAVVNFTNENSDAIRIEIFDLLGTLCASYTFNNISVGANSINIDLSSLTSGLYYALVKSGNNVYSSKIVKAK